MQLSVIFFLTSNFKHRPISSSSRSRGDCRTLFIKSIPRTHPSISDAHNDLTVAANSTDDGRSNESIIPTRDFAVCRSKKEIEPKDRAPEKGEGRARVTNKKVRRAWFPRITCLRWCGLRGREGREEALPSCSRPRK